MSDAMREALIEACNLLAERKHSNPARSPGHNARLVLEASLKSTPAPDAWRPIETAPRDESVLLTDARVIGWTQIASWDEHHQGWQADDSSAIWHRAMFTHWMPLPAPPVAQVKEG